MNKLFKYGVPILAGLIVAGVAYGTSVFNSQQLAPNPQNGNCLTTNGANPGVNGWSSCGAGTLPTPSQTGQILVASSTSFVTGILVAGTNITITTSTPGQITLSASGSGGSVSTSSVQSIMLPLIANGTVAGVNATSSTVSFNIQGSGNLNPFNVASSTGVSELFVSAAGNVGIGTTTPANKLDVNGGVAIGTYAGIAGNTNGLNVSGNVAIGSSGSTSNALFVNSNGSGNATLSVIGHSTFSNNGKPVISLNSAGSYYGIIENRDAHTWDFGYGTSQTALGTSTLAWTDSGNVGINTTTPGNALTVIGSISSSALTSGNCVQASTAGLLTTTAAACGTGTLTGTGTNGQIPYWTSSSALSSTSKLLFDGTVFGFNATSSTIGFNVKGTAGTNDIFNVASSSNTSAFVVKSTGSVGINTSTPASGSKLDISGQAYSEFFNIGTTSAATLTVDWSNGNTQGTVLATTTKLSFTNQQPGGHYVLFVAQDGGTRTMTYATSSPAINFPAATAPTLSTATGTIDILNFVCGRINCYGVSATNFASSTNIQLP